MVTKIVEDPIAALKAVMIRFRHSSVASKKKEKVQKARC